jgi:hypothetical protein
MKHINDLLKTVMQLWDDGEFLRTAKVDGYGVSLYKLDGAFHLIWYTKDNQIFKYESIRESEIEALFAKATDDSKRNDDNILKILFQPIDPKELVKFLNRVLQPAHLVNRFQTK